MIIRVAAAIMSALLVCCAGCGRVESFSAQRVQMDTAVEITVRTPVSRGRAAHKAIAAAFAAIDSVEKATSYFIENNDPRRIAAAEAGEVVTVSHATRHALAIATQVHAATRGTYDVTIGPLVDLWGFGRQDVDGPPSSNAVADALGRIGMDRLVLIGDGTRVSCRTDRLEVDLSSVAKGVAVDAAYAALTNHGFTTVLVNAGGEIRASMAPEKYARPWRVGIQVPRIDAAPTDYMKDRVLTLTNAAVATSGNYRRFLEDDARTYTHILDPRTGYPVTSEVVSVTVIAPTCAEADAWATGLFTLPPLDALRVAVACPRIACLLILRDPLAADGFRILSSRNFPSP